MPALFWGFLALLFLSLVVMVLAIRKFAEPMSVGTYFKRVGEAAFALLIGAGLTFVIERNGFLTVWQGLFLLVGLTLLSWAVLTWLMK